MKARTTSFIFTADANSAADIAQINIVKKTVKASNKLAKDSHKWACARAAHNGEVLPKAPKLYRVRLMGRGPRATAYADHVANGGNRQWAGFRSYLPQKYAERFDVYVSEVI
jgi:hypothetical protein